MYFQLFSKFSSLFSRPIFCVIAIYCSFISYSVICSFNFNFAYCNLSEERNEKTTVNFTTDHSVIRASVNMKYIASGSAIATPGQLLLAINTVCRVQILNIKINIFSLVFTHQQKRRREPNQITAAYFHSIEFYFLWIILI